jgi:hypothetical protein
MPKEIPAASDPADAVGKTYAIKDAAGSVAERRFKVLKVMENFDFGPRRGGRKTALHVIRLDADGNGISEFTPPADEFLGGHVEVFAASK